MLKKLVKYDFLWINRQMLIFFAITVIFAVLTRITEGFADSAMGGIIYRIMRGCTIAALVNAIINCAIRIWVRFRQNFYKDEAYLTHTLPVSKSTLYDGKIISSICTVLLSVIVVIASWFIAFWNNDIYEYLRNVFKDGDMSFIVISLFATAILEVIYAINVGIFSIVVGHRANNNRVLISIILGFALYYGLQCVLLAGIAIAGIFDDSIQAMFGDASNTSIGFSTYRTLMLITNLLYLTLCTGLYFGGKKLFAKGVNVE